MAEGKRLERKPVLVEEHKIAFKNFSGKPGQYNRAGNRNFVLILNHEEAEAMIADGWNVRHLKPREEGELPTPCIEIAVRFDNYPPKIVMITSRGRTQLTEELVEMLDNVDVESVDLTFVPFNWSMPQKDGSTETGIKAYLKTLYITIREDPLDLKYAGMDDASGYVPDWENS